MTTVVEMTVYNVTNAFVRSNGEGVYQGTLFNTGQYIEVVAQPAYVVDNGQGQKFMEQPVIVSTPHGFYFVDLFQVNAIVADLGIEGDYQGQKVSSGEYHLRSISAI